MHMTNIKVANVCFVIAQFQVSCKNVPKFLPVDTNSAEKEPCHIYLHQIHAAQKLHWHMDLKPKKCIGCIFQVIHVGPFS